MERVPWFGGASTRQNFFNAKRKTKAPRPPAFDVRADFVNFELERTQPAGPSPNLETERTAPAAEGANCGNERTFVNSVRT